MPDKRKTVDEMIDAGRRQFHGNQPGTGKHPDDPERIQVGGPTAATPVIAVKPSKKLKKAASEG